MNQYEPSEVSPPGDTIRELLEIHHKTVEDLARLAGRDLAHIEAVLEGRAVIDAALARVMAEHLGGTEALWLRRDVAYQAYLATKQR